MEHCAVARRRAPRPRLIVQRLPRARRRKQVGTPVFASAAASSAARRCRGGFKPVLRGETVPQHVRGAYGAKVKPPKAGAVRAVQAQVPARYKECACVVAVQLF